LRIWCQEYRQVCVKAVGAQGPCAPACHADWRGEAVPRPYPASGPRPAVGLRRPLFQPRRRATARGPTPGATGAQEGRFPIGARRQTAGQVVMILPQKAVSVNKERCLCLKARAAFGLPSQVTVTCLERQFFLSFLKSRRRLFEGDAGFRLRTFSTPY